MAEQAAVNGEARQNVAVLAQCVRDCQERCATYRAKVDGMEKQLWSLRVYGGIFMFLIGTVLGPLVTSLLIRAFAK